MQREGELLYRGFADVLDAAAVTCRGQVSSAGFFLL